VAKPKAAKAINAALRRALVVIGIPSYLNADRADESPAAAVAAITMGVLIMSWLEVIDRASQKLKLISSSPPCISFLASKAARTPFCC